LNVNVIILEGIIKRNTGILLGGWQGDTSMILQSKSCMWWHNGGQIVIDVNHTLLSFFLTKTLGNKKEFLLSGD